MSNIRSVSKQKGMAMFVSLIMLLLMSIIILHGARSSTLELLLGNNTQHTAQALMRAEGSVVAGERLIELNYIGAPTVDFRANPADGFYGVGEIDVNAVDWTTYTTESVGTGDAFREYIIEYMGPVTSIGGSIAIGTGVTGNTFYLYRISGRGASSRGGARVVQTIYATTE